MCKAARAWTLFASLLVMTATRDLYAQPIDAVGTRARGMGGAFVAVADDASATWWNPAGLATGAYFNTIIERGQSREPDAVPPGGPGLQTTVSSLSFAYPALGLSLYRTRLSSIEAPPADRQDRGTESLVLRSVSMTAFGSTFGQSIGSRLVVASTVRLARARAAAATAEPGPDLLDRAADLSASGQTIVDLDLGAMARFGPLRVGAVMKHVSEPSVGAGSARVTVARQGRAGIALLHGRTGIVDGWTAAFDADLTTSRTVFGDERRVAGGGELWLLGRRVGLRAGVSGSAVGERRTLATTGASVALRRGLFLEGALVPGSDRDRSGWSVSLRSAF